MSRIKIKNFGPIKEGYLENDGFLDISKVTVFVGNQGSGKSTVAKLISTFSWLEKDFVRSTEFNEHNSFREYFNSDLKKLIEYHRIENYLKDNSEIHFQGEKYDIKYVGGELKHTAKQASYAFPQILYIPSERNFISYIKNNFRIRKDDLPWGLNDFIDEFERAKQNLTNLKLHLPINNAQIYKDGLENLRLKGNGDYDILLSEASSGFQAVVPICLVSEYAISKINNKSKHFSNTVFPNEIQKTAFINIVEEPEQNLFPTSQWKMLQSLLEFNNMNEGNKLILTTHSPYLISYLTLLVKAEQLKSKIKTDDLRQKLEKIVSINSVVNSADLAVYELDETNGTVHLLETYNGLPSDENKLYEKLDEGNELFAQLLEIQQQLL